MMMSQLPESLVTKRLVLRRFQLSDAPALTEVLRNIEVTKWLSEVPWPYPDDAGERYIREHCSIEAEATVVNRAIELDGQYIGSIGLTLKPPHRRAYLGYFIGQPWWGRGLMSEAAEVMIRLAFEELDCVRLDSSCFAANLASANVLRKLGFSEEGLRERMYFRIDRWHDERLFGLLRDNQ